MEARERKPCCVQKTGSGRACFRYEWAEGKNFCKKHDPAFAEERAAYMAAIARGEPRAEPARAPAAAPVAGDVFGRLRAGVDERVAEVRAKGALIKAAVDRYVDGAARAVVESLERQLGLPVAAPVDMEALVLEVLGAVDALPEAPGVRSVLDAPAPSPTRAPEVRVEEHEVRLMPEPAQVFPMVPSRSVYTPPPLPLPEPDEDDADGEGVALTLPALRALTESAPLMIVGGVIKHRRFAWLRQCVGPHVEWIEGRRDGVRPAQAAEGRVRGARVCAVVMLDGFISHSQRDGLVKAANMANVPLAFGGKGGTAGMTLALKKLDAALTGRLAAVHAG